MSITINKELYETIQYHINNKMIINIERLFNGETDIIHGFPIKMSSEFLLMSVINDFHDEGYSILRTSDIVDAYSNESDSFNEQICILEGLQNQVQQECIKELDSLKQIVLQLKNYKGFLCIQCEQQLIKCTFYLGEIIAVF